MFIRDIKNAVHWFECYDVSNARYARNVVMLRPLRSEAKLVPRVEPFPVNEALHVAAECEVCRSEIRRSWRP